MYCTGLYIHVAQQQASRPKSTQSYAPVPVSALTGDDQWHISFKIPSLNAFSERSIDSIRTGVITKAVRTEVVQTITTLIANHTKRPLSEQYTHICSELVKTYPTLKDDAGNGYVSFRLYNMFEQTCFYSNMFLLKGFMED